MLKTIQILFLGGSLTTATISASHANFTTVQENGYIVLNGQVETIDILNDSFTINVDGESIKISMDQIYEDTMEHMIESDLIKRDSFVTVTGHIDNNEIDTTIKAKTINVYGE